MRGRERRRGEGRREEDKGRDKGCNERGREGREEDGRGGKGSLCLANEAVSAFRKPICFLCFIILNTPITVWMHSLCN